MFINIQLQISFHIMNRAENPVDSESVSILNMEIEGGGGERETETGTETGTETDREREGDEGTTDDNQPRQSRDSHSQQRNHLSVLLITQEIKRTLF